MFGEMGIARQWVAKAANDLLLVCFSLAAVLAVAGCAKKEGRADKGATQEAVLHVGNGAEPQDLDPHLVQGVPEHRLTSTLFEGLVDLDPETLEPIPAVAESWEISEDRKVYTFRLRVSAKWSNGDPVTAHDFVYAWRRILTPTLASEYAYMLFCIENARGYNEGAITDFGEVGVKALDGRTLEVALECPTPYFLSMQVHYTWYPVHQATIEAFGRIDERHTKWTRPGNLVGNGAFKLGQWEPNRLIRVVKNEHYWDAKTVRLDAMVFHPIDNLLTEERSFRSGELHVTESVPLNKVQVYQRDYPELIQNDPYLGTYFYRLNVTKPPFDDPRVRRAFAMAVDRESIVRDVLRAGQAPAYGFTPPNTAGYTCDSAIPYDVETARRLLAEAGYPNGEGLPPIELLYNTAESHKLVAEAIQNMWRTALNVDVSILNQDWKVYLATMNNLDYQIARSAWVGDFIDPINFLECFTTGNGNNRTGYSNATFDDLIARAACEPDTANRLALFRKAEAILLEDAPLIPIYYYRRVYLKSPSVKGWHSNVLGYISFKRLYLDDEGADGPERKDG